MASIETKLEHLDKEELIALIRRMIERHADLELLVELAAADIQKSVDLGEIRHQARHAFMNAGYDWRASYGIAADLDQIVGTGDAYAEQGDWRNAAAVYRGVLEEVQDAYETVHDEEGEIALVANRCAEKLGDCLAETDDVIARKTLLRALWSTYLWDVDLGGYGISDNVPAVILDQTTPKERRVVAQWVREALPPGDPHEDDFSRQWRRGQYGGFLLELEKDELDDETYLRRCRETGRWSDLITRLLERGRRDEAVAEARQIQDRDLLSLAGIFKKYGQADYLEPLVRERAQTGRDWRFLSWLREWAEKRGDYEDALALSEQVFATHHTIDRYKDVKRLAQKVGRWDKVRSTMEDRLIQEKDYPFLTELHLFEHEVGQALQMLEQAQQKADGKTRWSRSCLFATHQLSLRVAQAAEESHPLEAIRLYRRAAEGLIDRRGRDNYAVAVTHLKQVRDVYVRLNNEEAWKQCIHEVRENHRNLPALKDELKKAGL